MRWFLFSILCFDVAGTAVCLPDVRFENVPFRSQPACMAAARVLDAVVEEAGGVQIAPLCIQAPNLDAALLRVLGQVRS
jgi:hypothetical protein